MGFFCLYGVGGLILLIFVLTFTPCLGGGIGRHAGLKILWTVMSVPVRPRPEVLRKNKGEGRMRAFDGLYPHRMSIHSLRVAIEDYTSQLIQKGSATKSR